MLTDFLRGIFSYLDAYSFLRKNGLTRYYWYCGLIGLGIMALLVSLIALFSSDLSGFILGLLEIESEWISKVSNFIVKAIVSIFFFILFKYLVLIFTAPIMSKLSEDVESILDGDYFSIPFSWGKMISDFFRALRLSLRNIFKEVLYTIVIFVIGLFPIFTIATTPFIFLIQSYFAGFGNLDFYLERHLDTRQTIEFVKDNKALATGNGTIYVFLLAIPVIGVFFAPALGATAAALEVNKKMT